MDGLWHCFTLPSLLWFYGNIPFLLVKSPCSYGFPMFSFWFSCGFPMVFPCFSIDSLFSSAVFSVPRRTKHCYALAEAVRTCAVKGLKVEECYMPVTGAKKKVISHWTVVFYWEIYGKIWVIYGKSMFYGAPSCNFHGNFMGLVENMGKYGNISI